MKKQVFCVLLFMLTSLLCFSQQGMESTLSDISLSSASERLPPITYNRLLLAMSNPEYPVMPGDVYKLTYLSSHQIFSMEVIVGSDFIINLAIFGKINARNMTFNKIRSIVEQKVEQAYPGSTPSLILVSVGSFQVYLTGEVKQSVNIAAWGLTLLSEVVGQHLTPYSSNRDIEVLPEEGRKRQYDLFKAERFGMKEEDPYLKPGDTIIISKRDRAVRIAGEVRRPGQYELLRWEGLQELIQYYGDAFTELADKSRIKIDRFITGSDKPAETLYLDLSKGYDDEFMLKDLDVVAVPAKIDRLPIVYFEGALGKQLETEGGQVVDTPNKVTYRFKEGETLYSALSAIRGSISPNADLPNAFITREGESRIISINLQKLLYNYDPADDLMLKPFDRIVIPFGIFEIFIKGEVANSHWAVVKSLTRLSQFVDNSLIKYSSIRDIEIVSRNGESKSYDLFKAKRFGVKEEDPYLKPGDTIIVSKRDREVSISGEVRRPGKYQLLSGEGVKELIQYYGDAFTELAAKSRVKIDRLVTGSDKPAEILYLDLSKSYDDEFMLKDLDVVVVPTNIDKLPVVYFEGALGKELETEGGQAETSNKITYRFKEGETLYSVLFALRGSISPVADLANSFIIRVGQAEMIPINIEKLLYDYNVADDIGLKPYDSIIIPFKQFFVTVSGAVVSPGRYPYVPHRTHEYYVNLAGGIDHDKNTNNKVVIRDMEEVLRTTEAIIQPEDRIYVPANSFFYNFNKYFPFITTGLTLGITIMNIFLLMGN